MSLLPALDVTALTGPLVDRALGIRTPAVRYQVHRDVGVPMPDGPVLLADHYRPTVTLGPLPVVLIRCPYGRAGLVASMFAVPVARRGFQVFIQSTRGTFGSGGQFRPFQHEQEDGLATLAWLRSQPWCDGRVATIGASYLGHTQWAVAPYADPPLEAVSLNVTAARLSRAFYGPGGAPGLQNALDWTASIGTQERGTLPPVVPNPIANARRRRAQRMLPIQAADSAVAGAPVTFWRDFTGHAAVTDDFWAASDHEGAVLRGMPPVNMVTGWWDLFVDGQLRDYARLRAAGVTARITVGPWLHGEPAEMGEVTRSDIEWLDQHLRGVPAAPRAAVRLNLMPTDQWLEFETWPPERSRPTPWYLGRSGALSREAPAGEGGPSTFDYDPADPTPSIGGPLLSAPGKQADNAKIEARPDVLVCTGPVLEQDLDVVGPVTARVFLRTGSPHADVFVRVCDVDTDGVSRNVVDGMRRISPDAPADAVGSDGVAEVAVELFPTAYRFAAGHRIRVQVAGGAFPRFARNFGTGEPFATATTGIVNRFEIFHDTGHPSRVELPVLS